VVQFVSRVQVYTKLYVLTFNTYGFVLVLIKVELINGHNSTTVLYTKYVQNTKNYFPLQPKN
jgi:hypothetical protein